MNIYAIEPDYDFLELDLQPTDLIKYFPNSYEDIEDILEFSRNNFSLKSFWPLIKTRFLDTGEALAIPDLSLWLDGVLLLSPAAKIYASHFLESSGEFLPVGVEGEEWYLFNCLTVVEPNEDLTTESDVVFNQDSVFGLHLFKTTVQGVLGIYCTDKFKELIEEYKLKGLKVLSERPDYLTGSITTFSVQP